MAFRKAMSSNFPNAPTFRTVVKSSHQRSARIFHAENRRKRFEVSHQSIFTGGITQHTPDQVSVGVDESGHERHVAEIDHFRVRGNVHGSSRANGGDHVVRYHNNGIVDRSGARAIDQVERPSEQLCPSQRELAG